jgi:hypothetical protein
MRPTELGDGVVAVADEDPLVELCRAPALVGRRRRRGGQRVGELVQEETAQRARVAGVAREQGALDRLRQPDEGEHGPVEVRHVRREALALGGGERLDRVLHGAAG